MSYKGITFKPYMKYVDRTPPKQFRPMVYNFRKRLKKRGINRQEFAIEYNKWTNDFSQKYPENNYNIKVIPSAEIEHITIEKPIAEPTKEPESPHIEAEPDGIESEEPESPENQGFIRKNIVSILFVTSAIGVVTYVYKTKKKEITQKAQENNESEPLPQVPQTPTKEQINIRYDI